LHNTHDPWNVLFLGLGTYWHPAFLALCSQLSPIFIFHNCFTSKLYSWIYYFIYVSLWQCTPRWALTDKLEQLKILTI